MYADMLAQFNPTAEEVTAGKLPVLGPNFAKVWAAAADTDKTAFLATYSAGYNTAIREKYGYLFNKGMVSKSKSKSFELSAGNMVILAGAAMTFMKEIEAINPLFTVLPNLVFQNVAFDAFVGQGPKLNADTTDGFISIANYGGQKAVKHTALSKTATDNFITEFEKLDTAFFAKTEVE